MSRQQAYATAHARIGNAHRRRVERLLFQVPVFLAAGLGAVLMLTRFILVLRENLNSSPDDYRGVLLLAAILAAVSLFVVAVCAAAGVLIGIALRAAFGGRWAPAFRVRS